MYQYYRSIKSEDGTNPFFAYNTFDVTAYLSSRYKSNNQSVMGRLINNLVYALNQHKNLLRCIVVIPDDNIVKHVRSSTKYWDEQIEEITSWLVREFEKALMSYKDFFATQV